ncbi:hypothetical protein Vafri_3056 [Volvox africanus]|uniref:Uncharacterized protein n=1 Tax=Volvox africanus TaxID=51714 RepID=A0A8J4ASR8_9CHLO|nr:hypothetical protein Vafri_3056 [Volvox africanus]
MDEHKKYVIISYVTCIFAQVLFAIYAIVGYTFRLISNHRDQTVEEFITARGTQNRWRIGWSFFASSVGAWCITSPSSFAVWTGILGLVMYAFSSGIPVLIIALFGSKVQSLYPDVCTMPDFVGKRFGPVARTLVVIISLFNMSIALLAEYTTIGLLFKYFVGSVDYPIVIVVGILTMIYTAYGGLYISIITDQAQGILTAAFIVILVIYTIATFRPDSLPKPLPDYLGVTTGGYSSIYSMPCSLIGATVFSEAMWQKVWASESKAAVLFGGGLGFVLITVAVFLFGFGGWLAAWGGYVTEDTDPNLYLFQVFSSERDEASPGASVQVSSWVGVITLILAATMNESAVDSIQNGITAVLAQHFFKGQHTIFPRIVVLLVNIPLIVISLQGYKILSLFLITNLLTTCCFLLVVLGLSARLKPYLSETALVFGFSVAMLTVTAYGIGRYWNPDDRAGSVRNGAKYVWYDNLYDWDIFLVASGFSLVGAAMWAIPAYLLRLFGIKGFGISDVLCGLPGFGFITGDGCKRDLLSYGFMRPLARVLRHTPDVAPYGAVSPDSTRSKVGVVAVPSSEDPQPSAVAKETSFGASGEKALAKIT